MKAIVDRVVADPEGVAVFVVLLECRISRRGADDSSRIEDFGLEMANVRLQHVLGLGRNIHVELAATRIREPEPDRDICVICDPDGWPLLRTREDFERAFSALCSQDRRSRTPLLPNGG